MGHSRHFERAPATSGLPSTADISHKAGSRCVAPTSGPRGNNPPGPMVSTIAVDGHFARRAARSSRPRAALSHTRASRCYLLCLRKQTLVGGWSGTFGSG
jgi:hypothetical protein